MNNTTFKRQVKDREYSQINNTVLKDKRLSAKAKGIFCYILSLPDDWVINVIELQKHFTDGRESIANGIKELEKLGYFIRNKLRNDTGQIIGIEYLVIEKPEFVAQSSLETGFPKTDKPYTDNQQLLNTNNNKELNKQIVSKDTSADNASIAIVKEYNNGESSANNISNKDTQATDNIIPTEEIAASIYQGYALAFPNKKGHARKLAIQRIKSLLKNYTEQQLLSAIVKYKLEKKDTIAKQEWNFIKTADTFFGFEKGTKVEFIDRYITEEVNMTPKKELKKEELDFLSDDDFNF